MIYVHMVKAIHTEENCLWGPETIWEKSGGTKIQSPLCVTAKWRKGQILYFKGALDNILNFLFGYISFIM